MSAISGQSEALNHIKMAFERGTKVPAQVEAIMTLVRPNNEHFAIKVLDAAGEQTYPADKTDKVEKASSLLRGFLKSGEAPEGVIRYAVENMGKMMTASHRFAINQAFKI